MSTRPFKVAEFVKDNATVEVYQKAIDNRSKSDLMIVFDVFCTAEMILDGDRRLSHFIPKDQIPSLVIAVTEALEFISKRHKEMRNSRERRIDNHEVVGERFGVIPREVDEGIEGRKKLTEFKRGSVLVEAYNRSVDGDLAIRCCHEFVSEGERRLSMSIQQRSLRDLLISVGESWRYLEKFEKENISQSESKSENFGNTAGIEGGYYSEE